MANFEKAYEPLKKFEGDWCKMAGDRGGETYKGISRKFFPNWQGWPLIDAAKNHESFSIGRSAFSKHLAVSTTSLEGMVAAWYELEWWDKMGLAKLPQIVANEIFEQAVNLGMGGATRYIQRLCNAYNRDKNGRPLFDDLVEDGAIGAKTLNALSKILNEQTPAKLVLLLNSLQCVHYINLAAKNPSQRQFVNGWMTRTHVKEATA